MMLPDPDPAGPFQSYILLSLVEVKPLYEAESPDELALIDAAYAYNCKLLKRSPDRLVVSLPGDGQVSLAGWPKFRPCKKMGTD